MRLALDSTDSLAGGCTTHVALQVWKSLSEFDVAGAPRLVRLNPNVPFKTRGNGAVCLELGHAKGRTRLVGSIEGFELRGAESVDEPSALERRRIWRTAKGVVDRLREDSSETGLAAFSSPSSATTYERCVRSLVPEAEAHDLWGSADATQGWRGGRGLLGAAAAAAWPARRGTWELIAYREKAALGGPRRIAPETGVLLDRGFPTTFDNWDARHRHLRILPRSPCPVLAGVRGSDPEELRRALEVIGPERPSGWLLFMTNQATGDHLVERGTAGVAPYDSARLQARVAEDPTTLAGGHVRLRLADAEGALDAFAFEPTKEFRDAARSLRAGDHIEAEGGFHATPDALALEAFTLLEEGAVTTLTPRRCSACGIQAKSRGRRGGYRCPRCGSRSDGQPSAPSAGGAAGTRFTVPISVRRHLSRPNGLDDARLALAK